MKQGSAASTVNLTGVKIKKTTLTEKANRRKIESDEGTNNLSG